jgi:ATP-binding cassette subfamily B protein
MNKAASVESVAAPAVPSLWSGLSEIYRHMSRRRRRQLFTVLVLMLAGAVAELATIGAVIPFIVLLADTRATHHRWLSLIPGPHEGNWPLFTVAAAFIGFAVVAGVVRLQLAMSTRNFAFQLGHELTVEIQRRVLLQPYSFHVHRNTSTLLTVLNKTDVLVNGMLIPMMHAVTGGVIAAFVIAMLIAIDPLITVSITAALVIAYALFSAAFRRRLEANSDVQKTAYDERTQVVQESLGGIREVIIDAAQAMYLNKFRSIDLKLAEARATTQLIYLAPHYLIEMVGMILIAAIALVLSGRSNGIAAALPVLGTLALGAQRLLPVVQDVYRGWSAAEIHRPIFDQVVELLALPIAQSGAPSATPFEVRRSIRVEEVTLNYPTRAAPALDKVSLEIPAGSMVALVGATGSGKSTLVDVIMGLLSASAGRVLIDDIPLTGARLKRWHRSIAHVPQSIFLADTTIARNIALSLPDDKPDERRIVDAARRAQLHEFVQSLPSGYDTLVGERGVRLSGGQRQRLGIARAIYKDAPVLVLDEATSALDEAIEAAVIAALYQLSQDGRTIIIVAHRLSTIRHCDLVARLDSGQIAAMGTFAEVLGER